MNRLASLGSGGTTVADSGIRGAARELGRSTVEQTAQAGKSFAFWMIILGIVQYLLRIYLGTSTITYILSLGLFVFSGYALSQKLEAQGRDKDRIAILLPMLIFVVWYWVFDGNYDPMFLAYFIGTIVLISVLFAALTGGKSFQPELYGFLPVIFLFLDLGMIPFLVDKLNWPVTEIVQSLVLYMPWWAFFGLLLLPSEPTKSGGANFLLNSIRIFGILYVVFLLVSPAIPTLGYDPSLIPSAAALEQAQANLKEQLPQGENPALSNFYCIFSEPSDVQGCVQTRQENSVVKAICEKDPQVKNGILTMEDCQKKVSEERKKEINQVTGSNDPNLEPTKAEFVESQFFPKTITRAKGDTTLLQFPLELKIDNPRRQSFDVEVNCYFNLTNNLNHQESIVGEVKGGTDNNNILKVKGEIEVRQGFICQPTGITNLNGNYKLTFTADLIGLNSVSRLSRAFIGEKDSTWKEIWIPRILGTQFSEKSYQSQSPNDYARINFAFGNPLENPIVEKGNLMLASNIENLGQGKILALHNYRIELPGFTINDDKGYCKEGGPNVKIPDSKSSLKQVIYLPTCLITGLPPKFEEVGDIYAFEEFAAIINYDYQIHKDLSITVTEVS